MLLSYEEYTELGGRLDAEAFPALARKAESFLNRMTHNRIRDETPVRAAVKTALADLIDATSVEELSGSNGSGVSSQSNDGVSVTYTAWASVRRYWLAKKKSILAENLADEVDADGVPLLYAGVELDGGDDE